MTSWLTALTGFITLLLLAFLTFLTALLLLTTILLMMLILLLLGPFQFLFFLSVHLNLLNLARTFLPEKTHSKVVKFPLGLKREEGKLLALRTDNVHSLAV